MPDAAVLDPPSPSLPPPSAPLGADSAPFTANSTALLPLHASLRSPDSTASSSPDLLKWGSIISCMQSLNDNKHSLQKLAIDEDASKGGLDSNTKKTLLSEVFWDKLTGCLRLLKPVAEAITIVKGDNLNLSIVMKIFHNLQKSFDDQLSNSPVLRSEEATIKEVIPKRREFIVQKVHLAANLLDPRYRGCHISDEEAVDAIELIYEVSSQMPDIDENRVIVELSQYRAKERLFQKEFIWKSVEHNEPITWWNGLCSSTELSKVAAGILSLPPTSASVERSFSRHSHIHSRYRNRLTTDRAAKLVYVAHHLTLEEDKKDFHGLAPLHQLHDHEKSLDNSARMTLPSTSKNSSVSRNNSDILYTSVEEIVCSDSESD